MQLPVSTNNAHLKPLVLKKISLQNLRRLKVKRKIEETKKH